MFEARWPMFHEALRHTALGDWRETYSAMSAGQLECALEIFDRQKKLGFAMSAMPALCRWDRSGYVATHLSASEVPPEFIPAEEGHRIRFCPLTAFQRLAPAKEPGQVGSGAEYSYQVLTNDAEEIARLRPGQAVELQWKMQPLSPFGWWFGVLDSVEVVRDANGEGAVAHLSFQHFPQDSRWRNLTVPLGHSAQMPCAMGGYSGGLRVVSDEERSLWMRFFPAKPVVF